MWLRLKHHCVNLDRCDNIFIRNNIGGYSIIAECESKSIYLFTNDDLDKIIEIYSKIVDKMTAKIEFINLMDIGE
jgi:hypothetical protein